MCSQVARVNWPTSTAGRGGFVAPADDPTPSEDAGGYGLFLVTQIADAWGISENDETKVWFELRR